MYFSKGAVIAMSTTATATTTTTTTATATAISTTDGEVTTKTIAVGYSHIDSNRRIYDNNQDITPVVAFERVESIKNGDNNNINDIESVQHTKDETSIGSFSRPSIIVSTTDHMGSITDAEDRRRRANSLQNLGNHLEETLVHDEEAERLELMMKLRPTLAEEFLKQASVIDLYLLGVSIIACGILFTWNYGLAAGFWEFIFAMLLMCLAYWCLTLCLSEMSSALPFNGGMYGFIRLTIGSYFGFLVGCSEALQNILCVSTTVQPIGSMITEMADRPTSYEPIYWIFLYISFLWICSSGGKVFWMINRIMAIVFLILVLVYIFGSIPYLDYDKFTTVGHRSTSDGSYFMNGFGMLQMLPNTAWFYMGVESLPLAGAVLTDPKRSVAKSMIACMITFTVLGILVPFIVCSQSPGTAELSEVFLPFNYGYSKMFKMSYLLCNLFAIPGSYCTAFGFFYISSKQIAAMSKSGLLPACLGRAYGHDHDGITPITSYIAVVVVCLLINCIGLSSFVYDYFLTDLFLLALLGSFIVYLCAFIAYVIYRLKFSRLERPFTNPLGITSAVIGFIVFFLAALSVVAFQGGNYRVIVIFIGYLLICSVYYHLYGSKTMYYSDEEQMALFNAYVIKANLARRFRLSRFAKAQNTKRVHVHSNRSNHSSSSDGIENASGQQGSSSNGSMAHEDAHQQFHSHHDNRGKSVTPKNSKHKVSTRR